MSAEDVSKQIAELTRRIEALEARLGQTEAPSALREAGPVYAAAGETVEEGVVVPAKVLRASGLSPQELLIELAVHLFAEDLISLGVAKTLAGLPMANFMRVLGKRGIAMHYDVEDLEEDIRTLKALGLWKE